MRDGPRNLAGNTRKLFHLDVKSVARSTFADANSNKPAEFFQILFCAMFRRYQGVSPVHGFRFKNKLFSLYASTIKLGLEQFPWAPFRKERGEIKLHALLDHDGHFPSCLEITDARKHESKIAQAQASRKKLGTTSDQIIQVVSDGKPFKLRRMDYRDVKTGEHYVYQTNHFTLSARTDAEIYKERW